MWAPSALKVEGERRKPRAAGGVSRPLCGPGLRQARSAGVCAESEGPNVGTNDSAVSRLPRLVTQCPLSLQRPSTFLLEPGSSKNVVSAEV